MIRIDLHERLFLLVTDQENRAQVFPYHGCALPTELGGQLLFLQLDASIPSEMHRKIPEHQAHISIQRR
jgi:hypothetical protein